MRVPLRVTEDLGIWSGSKRRPLPGGIGLKVGRGKQRKEIRLLLTSEGDCDPDQDATENHH